MTKKPQKVAFQTSLKDCEAKEFTDGWSRLTQAEHFARLFQTSAEAAASLRDMECHHSLTLNGLFSFQPAVHAGRLHPFS